MIHARSDPAAGEQAAEVETDPLVVLLEGGRNGGGQALEILPPLVLHLRLLRARRVEKLAPLCSFVSR